MGTIKFTDKAGRKRKGILVKCKQCQTEFATRHNQPAVFCSRKCLYLSNRTKESTECAWCSKPFLKRPSQKSKSGLYCCSLKCKNAAQRIGGLTEICPAHYGTSETEYGWVWNEREHICIDCKESRDYYLDVHHIDGNRKNNKRDNLEIVCTKCHRKRHLKYKNKKWIFSTKYLTPRDKIKDL